MNANRTFKSAMAGLTLAASLLLAACGGSGEPEDMPGMDMSHMNHSAPQQDPMMGDPNATPADKVAGARLLTGEFKLLPTRPPGLDNAKGTAQMALHQGGTTVTLHMTGLKPGEAYMAHLHALPCAESNGGGHFRFDPAGPEVPPNEVHLAFTADQAGNGYMTVNNDRQATAKSLVVHPKVLSDNRVACADF